MPLSAAAPLRRRKLLGLLGTAGPAEMPSAAATAVDYSSAPPVNVTTRNCLQNALEHVESAVEVSPLEHCSSQPPLVHHQHGAAPGAEDVPIGT